MNFGDRDKFYCFSPPVMLLTFLLEFGLAFYVLLKYKQNTVARLAVIMLFALGVFQLAEFMICGGLGISTADWARIGYVSITLLPALGVHILLAIAKKKQPLLLGAAYGTAAFFALYFILNSGSVISDTCQANYAVFNMDGYIGTAYAAYYYGWLFISVIMALHYGTQKGKLASVYKWMLGGYASFIVPTTIANINDPATTVAIPSIMCGFAVILALILAFRVVPLTQPKKHAKKS